MTVVVALLALRLLAGNHLMTWGLPVSFSLREQKPRALVPPSVRAYIQARDVSRLTDTEVPHSLTTGTDFCRDAFRFFKVHDKAQQHIQAGIALVYVRSD